MDSRFPIFPNSHFCFFQVRGKAKMEKYINIYYRYIYLYINIYLSIFSPSISNHQNGKMGKWEFFFSPFQTGLVGVCQEIRRANSGNLRIGPCENLLIGKLCSLKSPF